MLGVVKRVCTLCVRIWLFIFHIFRQKSAKVPVNSSKDTRQGNEVTWDESGWGGDGWDEFTVKVVPNSEEEEPSDPDTREHMYEDQDFFKDMAPVFRKAKKVLK